MNLSGICSIRELYDYYNENSIAFTKADIERLLEKAMALSIDAITLKHILTPEEINLQSKIIKFALNKKIEVKSLYNSFPSLEALDTQKGLLLTHDMANQFLMLVLISPVQALNQRAYKYEVFQERIELQRKLIQESLSFGADLSDSLPVGNFLYGSSCLDTLLRNEDILLNMETAKGFTILACRCSTIEWNFQENKYVTSEKLAQQKVQLLKRSIELGANIDYCIDEKRFASTWSELLAYKKLLDDTDLLSPNALLKVALMVSPVKYRFVGESDYGHVRKYDREVVERQNEYILHAFEKGANIAAMSLKDLNLGDVSIDVLQVLLENGMDPQFLIAHDLDLEDSLQVLELAVANGVQIPSYEVTMLSSGNVTNDVVEFLLKNTNFNVNQKINVHGMIQEFIERGEKFKDHAEYMMKKSPNLINKIEERFAHGGTIAHLLAKNGKVSVLNLLVDKYNLDLNALNAEGNPPIFLAKNQQVRDFLINRGAGENYEDEIIFTDLTGSHIGSDEL